jgi:hypothetical protein
MAVCTLLYVTTGDISSAPFYGNFPKENGRATSNIYSLKRRSRVPIFSFAASTGIRRHYV